MSKLLTILAASVVAGAIGCAQPTTSAWHQRIATVSSTQPSDAIDSETGEPPWGDFADRAFPRPLTRETAFDVLLNTETFADAYVGISGTKSVQVEAFQVLLDRPDAKTVFSDLLERANTAGKLYALCAVYLIAPDEYAAAEQHVLKLADTVDQQMGCVTADRPVIEVVRCSNPNTVRLRRGETVKQWLARVEPAGEGAMFDISGGALPETFRDAR